MGRWGQIENRSMVLACAALLSSCSISPPLVPFAPSPAEPLRTIQIQQTWQIQAGQMVGPYKIAASLGDITIALAGGKVYAPFDGRVQPTVQSCVLFSSPDVPAYLFRLCGLNRPRLGQVKQGDTIGSGDYLYFAALRKLPEGTWTIVEPSRTILEQLLKQ